MLRVVGAGKRRCGIDAPEIQTRRRSLRGFLSRGPAAAGKPGDEGGARDGTVCILHDVILYDML